VADPGKARNGAEETWEDDPNLYANYEAGAGVTNAVGVWWKPSWFQDSWGLPDMGPLPGAVTGRTVALCHNHDPVCASSAGGELGDFIWGRFSNHTSYTTSEMSAMGDWLVATYNGDTYFPG
ncbi:MAG: hypothetical protein KDB26_09735, partial [Microthrixaceae bacterium]|nr:hypothetical protein [Microthrixaceae bacterium]